MVRHFVYCECFSSYRADVSCCTNWICLISHIQTGRCGRICFFNVLLWNLNANIVFCEYSFVVVRHFACCERFSSYRTDVSCCTNGMCLITHIQTGRCGRICFFPLSIYCCQIWMPMSCLWVQPWPVWHIVCCERCSGYRADVLRCPIDMGSISTTQTGRCGRIYFFPYWLLLPKW